MGTVGVSEIRFDSSREESQNVYITADDEQLLKIERCMFDD